MNKNWLVWLKLLKRFKIYLNSDYNQYQIEIEPLVCPVII